MYTVLFIRPQQQQQQQKKQQQQQQASYRKSHTQLKMYYYLLISFIISGFIIFSYANIAKQRLFYEYINLSTLWKSAHNYHTTFCDFFLFNYQKIVMNEHLTKSRQTQ